MNNAHLDEMDLATQQDVITTCDYETCLTIKSNSGINTATVVKSDGNLHSIKTGRNYNGDNNYKSSEDRTVGGAHQ